MQNRPLIKNLDELPFPAWHHLDIMRWSEIIPLYRHDFGKRMPEQVYLLPLPQVMHGLTYRLRSPENVVDEMEYDIEDCLR